MDLHQLVGLPTSDPRVQMLVQEGIGTVTPGGVLEIDVPRSPRSRVRPPDYLNTWERALGEHWGHPTFRAHSWAYTREFGFSCACEACDGEEAGADREWRISISLLRQMTALARDRFMNRARQDGHHGQKKTRRQLQRANVKAKALLHQLLTKEQRWELRGTKAFTITGGDGRTYRITEGSTLNVKLLVDGVATHSLCVVFTEKDIPVYDLMLAQKLMLEHNVEDFLKLAVVREIRPPMDPVQQMQAYREVLRAAG
jgi:hypothetical protein